MANTKVSTKSNNLFIIGLILIIIGGPLLMMPLNLILNTILGNPANNTSGRAVVNISTLLVWPISIIIGVFLIGLGRRKK